MRHHASWIIWIAIATAILLVLLPLKAHGQPVIFSVDTHRSSDTLYVGERAFISFDVDGQGTPTYGFVFPLKFSFGNGSLLGAMPDDVQVEFAPRFYGGFYFPTVADSLQGTDPDTLLFGLVAVGGPWITSGSEWAARLHFQPRDTGGIQIDSVTLPPANQLGAQDPNGQSMPIEWHSPLITVLPCPNVLGDVNQNGQVTTADIIQLVNCIFKCGSGPFDILVLGDVNCDEVPTVSDAIVLVNYVFKGMPLPFCCKVLNQAQTPTTSLRPPGRVWDR